MRSQQRSAFYDAVLRALRWDGQWHRWHWIHGRIKSDLYDTDMRSALDYLLIKGLIEKRSIGHHRPEYRITTDGRRLSQAREWAEHTRNLARITTRL